jgi:Domain of unknown function (DUF3472)/Domain of unknown function (DUF5077)
MRSLFAVVGCVVLVVGSGVRADDRLAGKACRSVHLGYTAAEGVAFYNEVTVDRSAPGTYFCACGWNKGYFGIQELGDGKKVVIFSVWDSNQDDPKAVAEDKRVKLLHQGEGVRIGRFGGEGSGGQSFLDYDWKPGATYRFLVTAKVNGDRTEYSGRFQGPDDKDWRHLVTFSTVTGGTNLGGYYSFVEDFQRDGASLTKERKAHFGDAWVKPVHGDWQPASKARFTGDSNPATNIDAGTDGGRFFLATGGATKNATTKLRELMALPNDANRPRPEGLPKFK